LVDIYCDRHETNEDLQKVVQFLRGQQKKPKPKAVTRTIAASDQQQKAKSQLVTKTIVASGTTRSRSIAVPRPSESPVQLRDPGCLLRRLATVLKLPQLDLSTSPKTV